MPYEIRKVGDAYEVVNKKTGKIHAKGTTLKKAKAQVRLLHARTGHGRHRRSNRGDDYSSDSSHTDSDSEDEPSQLVVNGVFKVDPTIHGGAFIQPINPKPAYTFGGSVMDMRGNIVPVNYNHTSLPFF